MQQNLSLKEALALIENGNWHALRLITADIKKGSGGMVLEIPKCRVARNRQTNSSETNIGKQLRKTDHRHSLWFTLNVELPNKQLRKVHPLLITHLNNTPVI